VGLIFLFCYRLPSVPISQGRPLDLLFTLKFFFSKRNSIDVLFVLKRPSQNTPMSPPPLAWIFGWLTHTSIRLPSFPLFSLAINGIKPGLELVDPATVRFSFPPLFSSIISPWIFYHPEKPQSCCSPAQVGVHGRSPKPLPLIFFLRTVLLIQVHPSHPKLLEPRSSAPINYTIFHPLILVVL